MRQKKADCVHSSNLSLKAYGTYLLRENRKKIPVWLRAFLPRVGQISYSKTLQHNLRETPYTYQQNKHFDSLHLIVAKQKAQASRVHLRCRSVQGKLIERPTPPIYFFPTVLGATLPATVVSLFHAVAVRSSSLKENSAMSAK